MDVTYSRVGFMCVRALVLRLHAMLCCLPSASLTPSLTDCLDLCAWMYVCMSGCALMCGMEVCTDRGHTCVWRGRLGEGGRCGSGCLSVCGIYMHIYMIWVGMDGGPSPTLSHSNIHVS